MNATVFSSPCETFSYGSHPSDKEIALLAFKNWKKEGSTHLRPEHWIKAERELMAVYASRSDDTASEESGHLDEFWEREMEAIAFRSTDSEIALTTGGWV
ncbi:DUF2934 domain-containing protein [Prosthecobacter vanneervenii]|uniref:DUF2934 domain-containing protein n=1 Tax=Prosthecobacter vanneervenii TaxID=48466 RepID=A0A7W7YBY4_9BACT|nr:DUF2934 domain-containing protein [Prosthecobacter vanneervenii]MBB5033356.1 hypothetical protein [Prosthecobacter vanneervenii]